MFATQPEANLNLAFAISGFAVSTATLDGLGQEAKGTLKVYHLKQPAQVARPATDGQFHYRFQIEEKEPKPDPGKPVSWELGEVAFSTDFTTDGNPSP